MNREEAIFVLKEILDKCVGLDGHGLELAPPIAPKAGYQIVIKGFLDQETKQNIQTILMEHRLISQSGNIWRTKHSPNKTEPDTLIIFKPKNKA